jgi:hypothetical protein
MNRVLVEEMKNVKHDIIKDFAETTKFIVKWKQDVISIIIIHPVLRRVVSWLNIPVRMVCFVLFVISVITTIKTIKFDRLD